jgi:hypothetical protein
MLGERSFEPQLAVRSNSDRVDGFEAGIACPEEWRYKIKNHLDELTNGSALAQAVQQGLA